MMRALSLKIPEMLYGNLKALAESRGVSKSELVREALRQLFERQPVVVRGSALSMLEDLVGSVDGPEDLSSNKTYLDDLGR